MTTDKEQGGLSFEQRHQLVSSIAQNFQVVHGTNAGCLTGFMMMNDRELISEAESYRSRAEATVGDDR